MATGISQAVTNTSQHHQHIPEMAKHAKQAKQLVEKQWVFAAKVGFRFKSAAKLSLMPKTFILTKHSPMKNAVKAISKIRQTLDLTRWHYEAALIKRPWAKIRSAISTCFSLSLSLSVNMYIHIFSCSGILKETLVVKATTNLGSSEQNRISRPGNALSIYERCTKQIEGFLCAWIS